jgi:hypothetical protein
MTAPELMSRDVMVEVMSMVMETELGMITSSIMVGTCPQSQLVGSLQRLLVAPVQVQKAEVSNPKNERKMAVKRICFFMLLLFAGGGFSGW